jgi:two-component system chemotaxis sensor kinase CheA
MQTELARLATLATGLTETLVGAAESESEVFASALRAAGGTARGLLLAVVVAAAIGGFIGWKSVRGSLAQLRAQNDDLRRLKDELTVLNEGLEAKVAERTAALDAKNQAMKMVLDNVEQGLATLNREGMLESERSARFDDWFGARIDGVPLARLLGEKDAKTGSYFELAWGELMDGIMPLEVNLAQLPRRVTFGGRTVELAYRAMETDGDVPERTLVVATDVTEQLERQRAEAAEREFARVFRHLMRDRGSFTDFFEEADATVRRLGDAENEDTQALFRAIHTLKGNCALYGLERMAELCHEVETGMVDEHRGPSEDEIARVRGVWGDTSKRIRQLLHDTNEGMAQVSHAEIDHLLGQLRAVDTPKHVVQTLERWHHEPVGARLERIGDQAKQLAKRLGKGDIEVSIRGEDVRLPRERLAGFWASLAHVVRNAMDHGLEAPDQRAAVGKSPHGHFEVAVEESADAVRVMLSDDGAGIDWDKLKAKARQAGLPDVGHDALVDVLFTDGVSSRDDVSAVSGRGVGMGAVRGAAERLGARIDVTSANGEGTTFTFSLPKRALRADATGTEVTGTLDLSPGDEGPRSP